MEWLFEKINDKKHNFISLSSRNPDYVMIHESFKKPLLKYITNTINLPKIDETSMKIFGIKVIFTKNIKKDEIIMSCGYNQ